MTKLRQLREKAGLKRNYVAEKLKVTPDHLNLLERGKANITLDKLESLAEIYGVDFKELAEIALEVRKENAVG